MPQDNGIRHPATKIFFLLSNNLLLTNSNRNRKNSLQTNCNLYLYCLLQA